MSSQLLNKISSFVPSRTTRQSRTFHIPFHRYNYAYYTFLPRTLRLTISLGDISLIDASIPKFKGFI